MNDAAITYAQVLMNVSPDEPEEEDVVPRSRQLLVIGEHAAARIGVSFSRFKKAVRTGRLPGPAYGTLWDWAEVRRRLRTQIKAHTCPFKELTLDDLV